MNGFQREGVPAAPNESLILGLLKEIKKGPEGIGFVWLVKLEKSENVGDLSNRAKALEGKEIAIIIHPGLKKILKVNDFIQAHIFFQGDEGGGAYFLIDDKVDKL